MNKGRSIAFYVLSGAVFSLAVAIVYFSVTLSRVADGLPEIVEGIQKTQKGLEPIVVEVREIKELIPSIVEEIDLVRREIPSVVAEVGEVRKQIPPVLDVARQYREAIPSILDESALLRAQLPSILEQVDGIKQQIPPIVEEVGQVRETIPSILAEIEAVREAVPGYLNQAESITGDIQDTVQKAGESAVQGVFTGIVKAPVNIVSNLGSNVLSSAQFDDRDRELVIGATDELLNSGTVGETSNWKNSKTGTRGKITILARDEDCATLRFEGYKRLKKIVDNEAVLCRQENGDWNILE